MHTKNTYAKALIRELGIIGADWKEFASCKGIDVTVFVKEEPRDPKKAAELHYEVARGICSGCLVSGECLSYAIEIKEKMGIWGGLDFAEREMIQGTALVAAPYGF